MDYSGITSHERGRAAGDGRDYRRSWRRRRREGGPGGPGIDGHQGTLSPQVDDHGRRALMPGRHRLKDGNRMGRRMRHRGARRSRGAEAHGTRAHVSWWRRRWRQRRSSAEK